jgi:hypothetical protein
MWDKFKSNLVTPFASGSQMTAGQLFVLIGLVLVFVALWSVVLAHLRAAVG